MKRCRDCKLNIGGVCGLFKERVADGESCPRFIETIYNCDFCGEAVVPEEVVISSNEDGSYDISCKTCGTSYNKCHTCGLYSSNCLFANDPVPIPPFVMKTMSNNNTFIQTQVINPDRVYATCGKCSCFDGEHTCYRSGCLVHGDKCPKWVKKEIVKGE